jgi:hypothetical protein
MLIVDTVVIGVSNREINTSFTIRRQKFGAFFLLGTLGGATSRNWSTEESHDSYDGDKAKNDTSAKPRQNIAGSIPRVRR